ncbi:uncharacterized protein [Ptychodera flava]|uniref:uncharacterized protein n=1 Tax=Ptychodera flava TaxID=63121 RepID=UPI003969CA81
MFHVYSHVLKNMERDGSVKFIWNGGDDVIVEAVEGPAKCSEKDVEKGYEAFVSFVQKHHSKITGKDIDLREKNVQAAKIIDAINYTHAKHSKILLTNKESKCLRILGEHDETKVAMETFYNYLGLGSQPARHGGKKRHGASAELTRSNSYTHDDQSDQGSKVLYSVAFGTVKVLVCKGDITKENVDAIANAANEQLSHGSGVAGAIVKAGGPSIQRESDEIMQSRRHKPLKLAEVAYTKAGNLPCKWVLHTVGPKWSECPKDVAEESLRKCCFNLLCMAEGLKLKSIAIPAIGTGLYGTPKDICAEMMYAAVIQYCTKSGASIEEIRFIDIDDTTVQAFRSVFSKVTPSKGTYLSNVSSSSWPMGKDSSVDGDKFKAGSTSPGSAYTGTGTTEYTGYQGQVGSKKALWSQIAADNNNTESSRANQGAVPKSTTRSTFNSNPQVGNGTLTDSDCAICLDKLNNLKSYHANINFARTVLIEQRKPKAQFVQFVNMYLE